jgi:spectinomycin phosphotransferase/16S rRNA (guanine(1405)-N(7))-methyltransferase
VCATSGSGGLTATNTVAPVFTRPADLDQESIAECLAAGWGFDVMSLEYQAVGFGSHHWLATGDSGDTRFVTVDDLRAKRRSREDTEDAAFTRLARAFTTVVALRDRAGLQFVVAALPDLRGHILTRLTDRYSLVVHPVLAGRPAGSYGGYESRADRAAVLNLLVQLHGATEAVAEHADRDDLRVPLRDELERAVEDVDTPWNTGPYGERARALLRAHATGLHRLLHAYDDLAAGVMQHEARTVITHGEPHAGNVLMVNGALRLIDWDTTLIAAPERDLWTLDPGDGSMLEAYRLATGVTTSPEALTLYRLSWDLGEIAYYVAGFRQAHQDSTDAAEAWKNLVHYLDPAHRWPAVRR